LLQIPPGPLGLAPKQVQTHFLHIAFPPKASSHIFQQIKSYNLQQ
jgi:hypothetical protein